jgi:hypothetical protein
MTVEKLEGRWIPGQGEKKVMLRRYVRSAATIVCGLIMAGGTLAGCGDKAEEPKTVSSVADAGRTLQPGTPQGAPGSIESVGFCNIEMLNGLAATETPWALPLNSPMRFDGWAADESNPQTPLEQLFIVLQDAGSGARWHARVSSRVPRPDVVEAKGSSLMSGFTAEFDTLNLPRGDYRVLLAFWLNGPLKLCDVGRRVLVQ